MNNTEKSYKKLPPFKGWVLQNFPFIEEDFDALTNYQMMCKVTEYLKVIQNNVDYIQDEEFTPLYNAFVELKNYVDNYFENLDIQTEINNKLDEMAESGQLADIIAQYLQVNSVLGFDTKASLKSAENLVNGSITRTLGTDTYNDGKGNYYKIRTLTSGDIIDDDNILALTNYPTLIAEKMPDYRMDQIEYNVNQLDSNLQAFINSINNKLTGYVTPQMFGATGNGTDDDTESFQDAIDYCEEHPLTALFVPYGNYLITDTLTVNFNEFSMIGTPRTEYHGRLVVPNNNFTVLEIKGYGAVLQNIEIKCNVINNHTDPIPLANGVSFYRTTGTSEDDNANIDCDITSCQFFGLNVGIIGEGRNFDITEDDFILCNKGIEITYNANKEMRDINIFHCRFHSIGENKGYTTDTCCIQMPTTANQIKQLINHISENFADFSSSFIKGSGHGLVITNNVIWEGHNTQIEIIGNAIATAKYQVVQICNNSINGFRTDTPTGHQIMETAIKINSLFQILIQGNTIMNSYKEPFYLNNCRNVMILDNMLESSPMNPELLGYSNPTFNYFELIGGSNINLNGNVSNPAFTTDNSKQAAAHVINRSSGSIRIGSNLLPRYGTLNQDTSFNSYYDFNDTIVS